MNKPTSNIPAQALLYFAKQVVEADDAHTLDSHLIGLLRSACVEFEEANAATQPVTQPITKQIPHIPEQDGLYWYHARTSAPEPVLISQSRYPERFKCFNGREQTWIRKGEFFTGPVAPPCLS